MEQEMKVRLVADVAGFETGLKQGTVLYDRFGKQVQSTSAKIETAAARTNISFNNLGRVSGSAGASVLAFSRIVQDAPFGIIGIGNNITQLVESFGALQKQSGSTKTALRSLFTSLIAPGNLLVLGISALTTVFTIFSLRARTAKKDTDDLAQSFESLGQILDKQGASAEAEVARLNTLSKAAQNLKLSMDDRLAAVDEIQSKYPSYFKSLSNEDILAGHVSGAYKELTTSILAAAEARAYEKAAEEESNRRLALRGNLIQNLIKQSETQRRIEKLQGSVAIAGEGGLNPLFLEESRARKELLKLQKDQKTIADQINQSYSKTISYGKEIQKIFEGTPGALDSLLGGNGGGGGGGKSPARKEIEAIDASFVKLERGITDMNAMSVGTRIAAGLTDINREVDGTARRIGEYLPDRLDNLAVSFDEFGREVLGMANYSEVLMLDLQRSVGDAFYGMLYEGENIFDAMGDAFRRMVATMVADLAAAQIPRILGAIFNAGLGPAGGLALGAGLGGVISGIGKFLGGLFGGAKKFSAGQILSGPTLSLTGEYPGARSNPEVIAPLSKLKDYMGGAGGKVDVSGVFTIRGQDLVLAVDRASRTDRRFFG